MLVTHSRALVSVVFLSTSLAIASPVGQGQATADPFLIPAHDPVAAGGDSAAPVAPGLSEPSREVLQRYYPASPGGADPRASTADSAAARSEPRTGSANPFLAPVTGGSESASVAVAPFSINGGTASVAEPEAAENEVDEKALRYYAEQRNLERVGAEIRRLKALHPQWTPPADLFLPKSSVSEQPVWDLFALGRYAEARQMISDFEAQDANYRPSADLTSKLDDAFAREAIVIKSDRGDWTGALDVARERPDLLVCDQIDVLWRVGESFARTKDLANAFELYRYILTNCPNADERRATMQKAALLLPPEGIEALITYGHPNGDGSNELEAARFVAVRSAIADETVKPARRSQIDPNEFEAFERFAEAEDDPEDANLLGWYRFNRGQFEEAKKWFDRAVDRGDDEKALEGVLLSLRNLDDLTQAEELAYENSERSESFAKIYVELVADRINTLDADEDLKTADKEKFAEVVDDSRSALGAQTLGWYELARKKTDDASGWFDKSVEWGVSEEGVLGRAVVASRTKDNSELARIKKEYGAEFAALSDIEEYRPPVETARLATSKPRSGTRTSSSEPSRKVVRRKQGGAADKLMRDANQLFESGQYQAALATLDRREATSGKTYGAEILRGWANYKLNRWNEAERVFRAEDKRRSTKATRSGIGAVQNTKYGMWPDQRNECTVRWKC